MQYLLTQAEYDALTPVERLQERNNALEVAREIIVKLSSQKCGKDYCDTCPVSDIGCASDGSMEDRPGHRDSKHICIKNRNYHR